MVPTFPSHHISIGSYMSVGLSSYILVMVGFVKVSTDIVSQRDSGLLKRLRLRGYSDISVLLSYFITGLIISWISVAIFFITCWAALDISFPVHPWGVLLMLLVSSVLYTLLGIGYSVLIPSPEASQVMVLIPVLILMFLSGVFDPTWVLPKAIQGIAHIFPLEYLTSSLRSMWFGVDFVHATPFHYGIHLGSAHGFHMLVSWGLLVCAAWTVGALGCIFVLFQWDKRKH